MDKKIIATALITVLISCERPASEPDDLTDPTKQLEWNAAGSYTVARKIKIDSVEYIVVQSGYGIAITKHSK